jgi:AcrR family transcriptional regulator
MRKTKEDKEKTRLLLLESAMKVFSDKGFNATRLEDIASGAGMTRGAFYWHFKNKEEIYAQVVELIVQDAISSSTYHLNSESTPLNRLRDFFDYLIQDHRRKVYEVSILIRLQQEHRKLSNMAETLSDLIVPLIEKNLNDCKVSGELDASLDVGFTARSIFSYFWGFFFNYRSLFKQYKKKELSDLVHDHTNKILGVANEPTNK